MVHPICTVHGCIVDDADDKELQEVLPVMMTEGNVPYSNSPKNLNFEVKESRRV